MASSKYIGPAVRLQATVSAYERRSGDPVYRPLRVFTTDSTTALIAGSTASIDVPWEPLEPGPVGALLEVVPADGMRGVDLDDPRILLHGGLFPSVTDESFHQQMVYAICSKVYAQFRRALGRLIAWRSGKPRLRLIPHSRLAGANAFYDPDKGEIHFGCFAAQCAGARIRPPGSVYTCLSHDIIVHEFTHALVDGLRSEFTVPTSNDVLGFHEGFADLIALLQHFTYPEVVRAQIRESEGNLGKSLGLAAIAAQFGEAISGSPARCAITEDIVQYRPEMEPHTMGGVLLAAVFNAFLEIYKRKASPFLAMAYRPPTGYLTSELVDYLANKASSLASQFLDMCVRALDYCPPVDMHLGEYLRALITADRELVPDDRWGYRDALIGSFAARNIYPPSLDHLSEDALLWCKPKLFLGPITALHFANLRFAGDPSLPASEEELERQATALWEYVTQPHIMKEFGLVPESAGTEPCCVRSIRTSRRTSPEGEVLFDLVAEVIQRRHVTDPATGRSAIFYGGSTIIVGPKGEVRYVISKNTGNNQRLDQQLMFQRKYSC